MPVIQVHVQKTQVDGQQRFVSTSNIGLFGFMARAVHWLLC